ncbi:type III secretion protein [Pseudomonas sp. 2822-15]|uniref:Type III secretion protein n=1 Tax=Pseudomonas salomonii TaxID=191391 RepID=A0A1H3BR98_9PSED|nr:MULTISPECIES: HrpT family type III secretion system protein [Pseudomonas]NWF09237.1 type III secretion protein [Pseudomonas salomonii]PIB40900.1 type III secretion protein [Pseudomonas sp. 2822-15]CRM41246.1 hypothetical protein [Pseudomonas sp. 58 R 3]SDX44530.1 hypothetical protein SAMN05216247_10153 [Pseudomonas salomonii]
MKHAILSIILIGAALSAAGCTPTCKGDSCTRPQSSRDKMVVWWPPEMRVDSGPSGERADHQTISLER